MATARTNSKRPAELVLKLDAAIYNKPALDKACQAFSHLARIVVAKRGRFHVVRFSGFKPAATQELADEFTNYALSCLLVQP